MNEIDLLREFDPHPTNDDAYVAARARLEAAIGGPALRTPTPTRPASRRFVGRALIAAAVTAVLVVGGVAVVRSQVDDRIDRVQRKTLPAGVLDPSDASLPMTVLVVGSDSRAFVDSAEEQQAFGSASEQSGQRADAIMLVRVTPTRTTVVSVPRDLLVDDGGTPTALNSSLNTGLQRLIDVVKAKFGVEVNHYVQVNFKGFIKVVDAAGGLRMNVPTPIRDVYSGLSIATPGCTSFNGNQALAFVRSRHLESFDGQRWSDVANDGDLGRIHRQQVFLRNLLGQVHRKVGSDATAAVRIADAVVPSLTVDAGFDRNGIETLVRRFVRDDPSSWTFQTLPVAAAPNDPNRLVETGPLGDALFSPPPATTYPVRRVPGLGDPC